MVSVVPLLVLILFFSSSTTSLNIFAHAAAAAAGVDDELNYIVVAASSLKPNSVCSGHRVSPFANLTGSWVPLTRPHGPCSAAVDDGEPSVVDMLRWDQRRADYIQRKLISGGNGGTEDVVQDLPEATAEVTQVEKSGVVKAPVGSGAAMGSQQQQSVDPAATGGPGVIQTMVLDTASDVPWVQCAPCPAPHCHPQTDVLYDPSKSGTSATFSCDSPTCAQLGPYTNGCVDNQCQYRVSYPDGSSSTGTYISDVLTLTPTAVFSKFRFGCSHAAQGSFSNKTAGIMALGGGAQSLASQSEGTYGDVFSYCLPPTPSYHGFFTLGVPRVNSARFLVTPMLRNKKVPTFYLVRLQAITVAGQRLDVPPTVFAAGAVMDSRAVITRLPAAAYQALRAAFRDKMTAYRAAAPKAQLDTCYDFSGVGSITLPRIALVFEGAGAGVELDPSGVLLNGCLAFTSNGGDDRVPGIIGNVQQQTLEVLYDVAGEAVGFRRGAC